jgi:peptidoglycan/xylan/chitin deacetylase (PgdA/CDA1 family)
MAVRTGTAILIFALTSTARVAWADGDDARDAARETEPAPRRLEGSVPIRGVGVQGYVALTFDDGPDHRTTPLVLDLLDAYGIKATFFVVGRRISGKGEKARKNREVLADILARGHMIGNHTYGHIDLTSVSTAAALADIDRSQRAIEEHAGVGAALFRPPFGRLSAAIRAGLRKRGYATVRWSIDPDDTRVRTAQAIRKHVIRELRQQGGGIVLLHDTKKWSVEALAGILEDLERENCRRLEAGEDPILPAELDWFGRDEAGDPLAIPEDVVQRTEASRKRLETRCSPLDQTAPTD